MILKLYLVERLDTPDYDEFESSLVNCEHGQKAIKMFQDLQKGILKKHLTVKFIGFPIKTVKEGHVISSYNAG